jgi:3-hydroxyacyl-[acyl-carrier-protein] dehydratase
MADFLSSREIQNILPHRYPFLLVDRMLELEAGKKAVGLKNVTINEPFFQGHFPGEPMMPGVLVVEALAQVGAAALLSKYKGKLILFTGINKFRFREIVRPGDSLILEVFLTGIKGAFGKGKAQARIGEKIAASGELTFAIVEGIQENPDE